MKESFKIGDRVVYLGTKDKQTAKVSEVFYNGKITVIWDQNLNFAIKQIVFDQDQFDYAK